MKSKTTAEKLRDKYTRSRPVCVEGCPTAQTVWLRIGVQAFCLDGYQETKREANWMRLMLGKALETLLVNETAQAAEGKDGEG